MRAGDQVAGSIGVDETGDATVFVVAHNRGVDLDLRVPGARILIHNTPAEARQIGERLIAAAASIDGGGS